MTGGRIVILGSTGRNFAAGMSGGIAYVLDIAKDFRSKVNMEMVELDTVNDPHEIAELRSMVEDHHHWTGSKLAGRILKDFNHNLPRFVRVMPLDYKMVIEAEAAKKVIEEKKARSLSFAAPSFDHKHMAPMASVQKAAEPAVVDLEDSMVDDATAKKRVETLDKVRGFMKYKRLAESYRNPRKRVKDWAEISSRLSEDECKVQSARCMDCGVPFCQSDSGCPIGNVRLPPSLPISMFHRLILSPQVIPKWNDLVFKGQWQDALQKLIATNNFPVRASCTSLFDNVLT